MVMDLLLAGFLLSCLSRHYRTLIHRREWIGPFLFIGIATILSSLLSLNPFEAMQNCAGLLFYMAGGFCVGAHLSKKYDAFPIRWFMGLSLIISFLFYIHQQVFPSVGQNGDFHGGFSDKVYYLVYLVCLCPFIVCEANKAKRITGKAAGYILFAIIILMIVIDGSMRGFVLMAGLVIFCFASGIWPLKLLNWIYPLLAIGALQFYRSEIHLFNLVQPWLESRFVQEQIQNHLSALNVFGDHPFLGVGWGQLEAFMEWSANGMTPISEKSLDSSIVTFLADTGIFGALGLIWLWITVFHASLTPSNSSEAIRSGARAIQVSCLLLGMAFLMQEAHIHLFSWCLIGLLYGMTQDAYAKRSE
ncbi:MAG: hypothetical protein JXR73_18845 [Candidatus Omnitrophica bacterium]|nr:hypothetical protein [Candidatus Omnitrophota bacterium]